VRWLVRLAPRFEVEARGGFRALVRRDSAHGSVGGSAVIGGGAVRWIVAASPRASFSLVARTDVIRVAYASEARDATIDALPGSALGWIAAIGPSGRLTLTSSLRLEGELLAGGSPITTTATDADQAVISTEGAAIMASLGLFFGL
jgi:hypothetical protein